MSELKQALLNELEKDDWQQVEVIARQITGHFDEHWKIQSTREQWATEVYINFTVEPVWDAPMELGQGITSITATSLLPDPNGQQAAQIALIDVSVISVKNMISKIKPFVFKLNFYRRTQCVDV
ncbi:hypothetical protein MNBD_GAMMA12-693 [hydrothermal vent metagenome]|uniref:Uncharacterized protein n=1 Tax=hydrothermal vent metagenome TaxID=652676 RepID=A0A3B0YKY1_9ZZZZ